MANILSLLYDNPCVLYKQVSEAEEDAWKDGDYCGCLDMCVNVRAYIARG